MKSTVLLGAASALAMMAVSSLGIAQTAGQKEQMGGGGGAGAAQERSQGGASSRGSSSASERSGGAGAAQGQSAGSSGASAGGSGRAAERSDGAASPRAAQGGDNAAGKSGRAAESSRGGERNGASRAESGRGSGEEGRSGTASQRQRAGEADRDRGNAASRSSTERDRSQDRTKADRSDRNEGRRNAQTRSDDRDKDKSRNAQHGRSKDNERNSAAQGQGEGTQGRVSDDANRRTDTARDRDRAGSATDRSARDQDRIQDRTRNQARDQDRTATQRNTEVTQGRQLTPEHRERVRTTILRERPQRAANVNVSIRVGERLPRRVQLRPLPATIISDVPYYRGYRYVMVQDEICIVDPATYQIVEVIDTTDRGGGRGHAQVALQLSSDQRAFVYEEISRIAEPVRLDMGLAIGAELPSRLQLDRFPVHVVDRVPELERYRYVFSDERVVVVDPGDREVVLLIGR